MKKSNALLGILLSAVIFGTISCHLSSTEMLENAKIEADEKLSEARAELLADIESYKNETDTKISANEQSIKEFKARIVNIKKEAKAEYDQKISNLEKKNTDLKRKLDEYKLERKEQWDSFKSDFNHDMDELGKALNDLMVNNSR